MLVDRRCNRERCWRHVRDILRGILREPRLGHGDCVPHLLLHRLKHLHRLIHLHMLLLLLRWDGRLKLRLRVWRCAGAKRRRICVGSHLVWLGHGQQWTRDAGVFLLHLLPMLQV